MTVTARSIAYDALKRIEADGAYANIVLNKMLDRSELGDMDRRFATELVYGTTRMRRACDAVIDRFITSPPDPATRTLLRLGAYQLEFAGVPPHAAVGETVALAPKRVRGFVNAVLRRASVTDMVWPSEFTRLSYPDWIGEMFVAELGADEATKALRTMNTAAKVTTRDDGYVQNESSQWVAAAVECQPGERVLDTCAAPGGKATAMAATGAIVTAADVRPGRVGLITENAHRLGLELETVVADAVEPPFEPGSFDAVVIDAPCSGLGALRRRADARWRRCRAGWAAATHSRRLGAAGAPWGPSRVQRVHDHGCRIDRPPGTRWFRDRRPSTGSRRVATVRARLARDAPRRRHRRHGADSVPSHGMSATDPDQAVLSAKVLTVSDGVFHGARDDTGGRGLAAHLAANGFELVDHRVTQDGAEHVAATLIDMSDGFAGLIVTTGGTGFAPRDQTPEGTRAVIERDAPGLAEAMRLISPFGRLSRGVTGIRGDTIICNTPGSPKGTIEQIDAIIDVLPHALRLLHSAPTDH
jgi:16S rRNA (cytosine967-C5)-methyltransferase